MKKIFCLISVLILIFAVVSCDKKKKDELPDYEEQVSKEIKADEGGKVESSDGKTSVDIPAGALDEDTTITMTIYDASGYSDEKGKIISKVVDFEPAGTIFKKPVIIKMATGEKIEGKTITAAVYNEKEEKWSGNRGSFAILTDKRTEAGDPIMQTLDGDEISTKDGNLMAAGDPIMTSAAGDPIMMSAAGDPIMLASLNAAGDPIMMNAAGDPIMIGTSSAGDPIMTSAAGDPIMMTTGHFTAYTFISTDPREKEEEEPDDDEPVDDSDTEEPEPDDDSDTASPDEDIIPEPELVFPTVLCTGLTVCSNGLNLVECPKEGEDFYGQDANYIARGSCIPKRFTKKEFLYDNEGDEYYAKIVEDENTHLMWCVDKEVLPEDNVDYTSAKEFCENLNYGGYEDWRLPKPAEFMTITDEDSLELSVKKLYFSEVLEVGNDYWTGEVFEEDGEEDAFVYAVTDGIFYSSNVSSPYSRVFCVRGEEYGKVSAENYTSVEKNGEEMIKDSSTNLFWQKTFVSDKTWKDALAYCENLEYADHDDWRLPNKHELASLVDYSKAGGSVVSSFPGMTADTYWTSTVRPYYGGDTGGFVVEMEAGRVTMDYSSEPDKTFAVRCVRSDLKAKLPENEVYPCDATGHGPCKDGNGKIWSSRIFNDGRDSAVIGFDTFAEICRYRGEAAANKWRIPTISELRTTIPEGNLATGGECRITDQNSGFENFFDQEECSGDPTETTLYDYGYLISGTPDVDNDDIPWAINTVESSLDSYSSDQALWNSFVGRCVLDDTLNYEKAPYHDSANSLRWSNISSESKYWYEAAAYCKDLVEDGSNNWRVPTMEEIQTLVRNRCDEDSYACPKDFTGKYSVLGDAASVWTSTFYDGTYFGYTYNFTTAESVELVMSNEYDKAKVRCVRGDSEPENVSAPEFPYSSYGFWSEVSGWISNYDSAVAYCDSLNEAGYGNFFNWRLPEAGDLAGLIDETVCGSNVDQYRDGIFETSRCSEYSFEGYSVIGDMFRLITASKDGSNNYYMFNFASGAWTTFYVPSGYVRCFTSGA